MLLGASGCVLVAIFAEHLELVVDELGRADLNRVLRLQLVRGGIIGEPERGLAMSASTSWLVDDLLLLLVQHDDLLLVLGLGRRAVGHGGPSLRIEKHFALEHLGLAFGAGFGEDFGQTGRDTGPLMVSFMRMADLSGAFWSTA